MESIIFRTLLHSLWQGLILALLTAAVLIFTHKSTARVRYNLLISCFMLFSMAVFFSFIYEWNFENAILNVGKSDQMEGIKNAVGWSEPASSRAKDPSLTTVQLPWIWVQNGLSFFNSYANKIVLLWLLVIAAKSVQLFAGLYSVKRIRHTKITSAGPFWENRVQQLAIHAGIYKMVGIVQSGLVKVPMVVGYFKPLILIPIGLLNNLSREEVEAIISHELAHVKRRDYLVNILQSFMELLFFFNPAVLWISRLIREERESCCDDLAVLNTNNKAGYIRALVSCEEFQMNKLEYAMAMADQPHQLVKRVKRMVVNDAPALSKQEQRIMIFALIGVVILSMGYTLTSPKPIQESLQKSSAVGIKKEKEIKEMGPLEEIIAKVENGVTTVEKGVSEVEKHISATEKMISAVDKGMSAAKVEESLDNKKNDLPKNAKYENKKSTITKTFNWDGRGTPKSYDENTPEYILHDLLKDGLVERDEKLSFEIDKDKFLLNDKNLPEDLRKRYIKKYLKSSDWSIFYKQEFESNKG